MSATTVELDDYRWLTGDEGRSWLTRLAGTAAATAAAASRLRRALSAPRAHLVLEQLVLRRRAARKFSAAGEMFFTPRGLEQASDEFSAAYKSSRFPEDGLTVDFCSGIGGDLVALARRRPVRGIDRDPRVALLAEANLRLVRVAEAAGALSGAAVVAAPASAAELAGAVAWHADPDRRAQGRRTSSPAGADPPPELWDRLRRLCPRGAVKLAPAARIPADWAHEAEAEWISWQGQCRQQVVWFPPLARWPGRRAATILSGRLPSPPASALGPRGEPIYQVRTVVEPAGCPQAEVLPPAGYLFEPDAAVVAARLVDGLAAQHNLSRIHDQIAYLSGPRDCDDAALTAFKVLDVLPLDLKRLRGWLRQRRVGRLEIKVRGASVDPVVLARRLGRHGDQPATLLATIVRRQRTAILAQRVARTSDGQPCPDDGATA